VCKTGIFYHHIISVEKVSLSLELFMLSYSSKNCVKENTSLKLNFRALFFY
jgi:hypothetical protein